MAVYESKRESSRHPPASIAVMMMMIVAAVILINANSGGAAVVLKSNVTYGSCIGGREEGCLIAEDLELELLGYYYYSSQVSRVLAQKKKEPGATPKAGGPTNVPCNTGKNKPYNCDTNYNPNKNGDCRNTYNRGCK